MPSKQVKAIALSGMLAAVAVVIMCLGGFIPIATYACPMLCTMTQLLVLQLCGKRIGWTWFVAVSILCLLLGPDKEAVLVFLAIGYYPLLKGIFEKLKLCLLWKLLYFNCSIVIAYSVMIYLLGMQEIAEENTEFGVIGLVTILIMGNVTFFLQDKLLTTMVRKLH